MILIEHLVKTFRRVRALDSIDLSIGPSERVALVGSNGAGKTTLIRCLLGEYVCDGTVRIDGFDPRRQRAAALARIGFVPQLPPPLRMPVSQLVGFSAALCGVEPRRIVAVAGQLGLDVEAVRARQFVSLSGGMKQKLLIAIALGRDARVLVLDEPAASLDPEARRIFFDLLAQRLDETTMILSSHRLAEVSALVNRVVEMDMGRVALDDKVAGDIAPDIRLPCRIVLGRFEPAFVKALDGWEFAADAEQRIWHGEIAGPDRLRFLGIMSRYTGLVISFSLGDDPQ
ncbi:MAG: ABC transporter ATP-binding protein [Azoarcus sp.]|jgi:ABC-2 type transport system ATP-binding protein|nr:ABC transporter ATP-binding protein [Azoarcus sp.]